MPFGRFSRFSSNSARWSMQFSLGSFCGHKNVTIIMVLPTCSPFFALAKSCRDGKLVASNTFLPPTPWKMFDFAFDWSLVLSRLVRSGAAENTHTRTQPQKCTPTEWRMRRSSRNGIKIKIDVYTNSARVPHQQDGQKNNMISLFLTTAATLSLFACSRPHTIHTYIFVINFCCVLCTLRAYLAAIEDDTKVVLVVARVCV